MSGQPKSQLNVDAKEKPTTYTKQLKPVICSCGEDISDLVAQTGNKVAVHKASAAHKRGEAERAGSHGPGSPHPPVNPAPTSQAGSSTSSLRPEVLPKYGPEVPAGEECLGMPAVQCGFEEPFASHYPWTLHSKGDLSVNWTATSNGRLISWKCLGRPGIGGGPCEHCFSIRTSTFIKSLASRQNAGPVFQTMSQLAAQLNAKTAESAALENALSARGYVPSKEAGQPPVPFDPNRHPLPLPAPGAQGPPAGPPNLQSIHAQYGGQQTIAVGYPVYPTAPGQGPVYQPHGAPYAAPPHMRPQGPPTSPPTYPGAWGQHPPGAYPGGGGSVLTYNPPHPANGVARGPPPVAYPGGTGGVRGDQRPGTTYYALPGQGTGHTHPPPYPAGAYAGGPSPVMYPSTGVAWGQQQQGAYPGVAGSNPVHHNPPYLGSAFPGPAPFPGSYPAGGGAWGEQSHGPPGAYPIYPGSGPYPSNPGANLGPVQQPSLSPYATPWTHQPAQPAVSSGGLAVKLPDSLSKMSLNDTTSSDGD